MITITVSGKANTGKSTVSELIYHRLWEAGFTVEWEEKPYVTKVDFGKRLDAVAKKTPVRIEEMQTRRRRDRKSELLLEPAPPTLKAGHTDRGFRIYEGTDRYGGGYSLQESSLATEACIWLGQHPVPIMQEGWNPEAPARARELPEEDRKALNIYTAGRMHLTREMADELIPLLQHFVEHWRLP